MGGEGHIMDMNKRIKQNRSLRSSVKRGNNKFGGKLFKTSLSQTKANKKNTQTISPKERQKIRDRIRLSTIKEKKREIFILIIVTLFVLVIFLILINREGA